MRADPFADLAVIGFSREPGAAGGLSIADRPARDGDPVVVLGFPGLGNAPAYQMTRGNVSHNWIRNWPHSMRMREGGTMEEFNSCRCGPCGVFFKIDLDESEIHFCPFCGERNPLPVTTIPRETVPESTA